MKEEEVMFEKNAVIVSATNPKGHIIYANTSFCDACGYTRQEIMGKPHNIIRHPDMPKTIFALLWERVLQGKCIYAFVKNSTRSGGYYWVKAYVAPLTREGKVEKIISYRKPINDAAAKVIVPLYAKLREIEQSNSPKAARTYLENFLNERSLTYDQFIDRLSLGKSVHSPALLSLDIKKHKITHTLFKAKVFRQIDNNVANIHIPKASDCALGKWIQRVNDQPFARTKEFQEVCSLHDHIHTRLKAATQTTHTAHERTAFEREFLETTEAIFLKIQHLTDTIKE